LLFAAGSGDLNSIIRLHLTAVDMGLYDIDGRTALHIGKLISYILSFLVFKQQGILRQVYV